MRIMFSNRSASLQTPFLTHVFIPRVQEPAAIRPLGIPSLTSSKLLTLGIAQASLDLLSLNRNFQTVLSSEL